MTNKIDIQLTEILSEVIPIMRDEAASDEFPYAVYSLELQDRWTKTGVTKIFGTLYVSVYATDYSTMQTDAAAVISAIETGMQNTEFRTRITKQNTECEDGIWASYIEYAVAQYDVPATPNTTETNNN